jgi:hypothetical protein
MLVSSLVSPLEGLPFRPSVGPDVGVLVFGVSIGPPVRPGAPVGLLGPEVELTIGIFVRLDVGTIAVEYLLEYPSANSRSGRR